MDGSMLEIGSQQNENCLRARCQPNDGNGAYQELQARGILRGSRRPGTIVVGTPPDAATRRCPGRSASRRERSRACRSRSPSRRADVIGFGVGLPDPRLYPIETLDAPSIPCPRGWRLYNPAPAGGPRAEGDAFRAGFALAAFARRPRRSS
jgi:hypothetical protein